MKIGSKVAVLELAEIDYIDFILHLPSYSTNELAVLGHFTDIELAVLGRSPIALHRYRAGCSREVT